MLVHRITDALARFHAHNKYRVIIASILITALFIPGIILIVGNVQPSLEQVLPQSVDEVSTLTSVRDQFSADLIYVVLEADYADDLRSESSVEYMSYLDSLIETEDHVLSVQSIADAVRKDDGSIPVFTSSIKSLLEDPSLSRLISSDGKTAIMIVQTDVGIEHGVVEELLSSIQRDIALAQSLNPGITVSLTGYPVIDKDTFTAIINDFLLITLVAFAVVAFIVYLTFRSFIKMISSLLVVLFSLIWTLGIVGYLGMQITIVSMVAAAMILGLGIDFGIHMVIEFSEHLKKRPVSALKSVFHELLGALTGASLTTAAGFLALLFGVLPAMQTLGIILAIGVLLTLVVSVFILPSYLVVFSGRFRQ